MARPRLFLHDSVGPGLRPTNQPGDVIAVKQRLNRLGFYEPPPEGFGDDIDAGLDAAVRAFQTDNGLQIDGRLEPGGETERNLAAFDDDAPEEAGFALEDIALTGRVGARGENAKQDVTQVKTLLASLGHYQFDRTRPPPPFVDTKMVKGIREVQRTLGVPVDGVIGPDGETLDALKKSEGRPGTRPGETEVAGVGVILQQAAKHGPKVVRQLKKALRDMGILKGGEAVIDTEKRRQEKDRQNSSNRDPSPPAEPNPPFPGDPIKPDNVEKFPAGRPADNAVEGYPGDPAKLPDRTELPKAPRLPDKVIYESLEDDEFWRQVQILRRFGNEDTKMLNTKLIDFVVVVGTKMGRRLEIVGGGYIGGGYNGDGEYRSEFTLAPQGDLHDPSNPNKNRSYLDLAVQDVDTKEIFFINTTDIYRRTGELKPGESHQVMKVHNNKESHHHLITVPKPRKGEDLQKYVESFEGQIRDFLKQKL
jgi:peptidoglycan hydrolase-like protein with peptidoglycan-binding domain